MKPSSRGEQVGKNIPSLVIDTSRRYQQIDNFGASDAWSCQFVGQWPEVKKNAIADLLFSMDTTAEGTPKGIGLSLWRFNIGAGSADQGADSGIRDEWRRAQSFLLPDGEYDWQQQAGQQWFLKAAKARGVDQFLAFVNSPPVYFTNNGKAFAEEGQTNLSSEKYADFATFLTTVIKGVAKQTGVQFQFLSPVNEPQWDWSDGGQEGTPFRNMEIAELVKAINAKLEAEALPVSIDVAEAGKINYLYTTEDKPQRGDQISGFFDKNSPYYIGDLSRVGHAISAHSYFTTSPAEKAVAMRKVVAQKVASVPGLKYWMSEYCILGDNEGEIRGNKRDLGMESALYLAQVIHRDLAIANANAWHWWLAVSPYDYKDGLVYIDKQKEDGNYYDSKMLWVLGNYSRFIRPGARRVEAGLTPQDPVVQISAFLHPNTKQMTIVAINAGTEDREINLSTDKAGLSAGQIYITDGERNLQPLTHTANRGSIMLPGRSVTTILGNVD